MHGKSSTNVMCANSFTNDIFFCLQNVILYEYLPALLNEGLEPYNGYKPDTHPGITHVFQSAAFRFGHTLIPPGIYRRDGKCNYRKTRSGAPAIRLCASWWDSEVCIFLPILLSLLC